MRRCGVQSRHVLAGLPYGQETPLGRGGAHRFKGLERGKKDFGVGYRLIICRHAKHATLARDGGVGCGFSRRGVVGFDLAGEEGGILRRSTSRRFAHSTRELNVTIHAGEAFGGGSIWQAVQWCGAHRIGHATRLIEDIGLDAHDPTKIVKMGYLAQYILDHRIPLEICLSSNVDTGAAKASKRTRSASTTDTISASR